MSKKIALIICFITTHLWGGAIDKDNNLNLIATVQNAPVVSNGLSANEPTELNILLNIKDIPIENIPDIKHLGYKIPLGGEMIITFQNGFERNGIDNTKKFVKVDSNANLVLVNGHPQNPIVSTDGKGVQHGDYEIIDDGKYTFRIKRLGKVSEREEEVGIKTIHLRPNPKIGEGSSVFTNKGIDTLAGIKVVIKNSNNKIIHRGVKSFKFMPNDKAQVHVTNIGLTTKNQSAYEVKAELVESVNFQSVKVETSLINKKRVTPFSAGAPYAPRFLLFKSASEQPNSFIPQVGYKSLSFERINSQNVAVYNDSKLIGEIILLDPKKSITSKDTKILFKQIEVIPSGDGFIGRNGTLVICPIEIGQESGIYELKFKLNDGNTAHLFTNAIN